MQPPRFRAWHKAFRRMLPVRTISFADGRMILDAVPRIVAGFDEVILMEGSGFVVGDGRTMYDADVIRDSRYPGIYRVEYRQDFGWDCYEVGGAPEDSGFSCRRTGRSSRSSGTSMRTPNYSSFARPLGVNEPPEASGSSKYCGHCLPSWSPAGP